MSPDTRATLADALQRVAEALRQPEPVLVSPGSGATPEPVALPWSALLWSVPADTRIGVKELAEALSRPRSWVYRHTGPKAPGARIPHRRLDGELVFLAGEIRRWLTEHESVVVPGRTEPLVVGRLRRRDTA